MTRSARVHLCWQYSPFGGDGSLLVTPTSLDGARPDPFTSDDIEAVVAEVASGNQFDGSARFVVRLRDGRFAGWSVSYESPIGADVLGLYVARDAPTIALRLELPA